MSFLSYPFRQFQIESLLQGVRNYQLNEHVSIGIFLKLISKQLEFYWKEENFNRMNGVWGRSGRWRGVDNSLARSSQNLPYHRILQNL
jgi:hypothetical protein